MEHPANHVPESGYEALIEQNNVGIYEIKGEEFSYVNQRFADVFGYEQAELVGASPFSVIAEDEREKLEENMAALARESVESVTAEHTGVRKNGEEVVVRAHGTVVAHDPEPVYLGFVEDITERKRHERRFEAIFNNTFQFTGLLEPDGTVLEANETALYFGDVDKDDVIGKPLWETYWLQSNDEARETAQAAVSQARNGDLFRDEMQVKGATEELVIDFSVRPVTDETGTVTQLIAEGRNITERKEQEKQLQIYEYACNSAFSGIAIASLEGELRSVNPAFCEMWGYADRETVRGRSVTEFWNDPGAAAEVVAAIRETGSWEGELEAVRQDGSTNHRY